MKCVGSINSTHFINRTHFIKDSFSNSAHITLRYIRYIRESLFPEITDSINIIASYAKVLYLVYDKKPLNTAPNR